MRNEDKVYEFEGKVYCEEDKSVSLGDRYGGDLFDLFWELQKRGYCSSITLYTTDEFSYESWEELLAEEFSEYALE